MKRTELTRSTELRRTAAPARMTPMRYRSAKRAAQERTYSALRREFLTARPRCEFPGGCAFPATDVHHRAGRVGALLLDVARWSALCREHHAWTTEHPAAAVAKGISELRVTA